MFTRRTRTVSFRVLEEEYEHLRDLCISNGARSLSDVARDALRQRFREAGGNGNGDGHDDFESRLDELNTRVQILNREVGRLLTMVEK